MNYMDKIIAERYKIINGMRLDVIDMGHQFLYNAEAEELPDDKIIRILDYFRDIERASAELGGHFFWLYDPDNREPLKDALDHVYNRLTSDVAVLN